jgi:hypothetical protein
VKTSDLNLVEQEDSEVFAPVEGLVRYGEATGDNQQWCTITEIIVPTEHDRAQLLKAFEYIHNLRTIDSDYLAVNEIMHLYQQPEKIKVVPQ